MCTGSTEKLVKRLKWKWKFITRDYGVNKRKRVLKILYKFRSWLLGETKKFIDKFEEVGLKLLTRWKFKS
jgi:hypothetical protein